MAADFIGVYSTKNLHYVQENQATAGVRKQLWFVWRNDKDMFFAQPLNAAYKTIDEPRRIPVDEFEKYFALEPKIFVAPIKRFDPTPLEEDEENVQESVQENGKSSLGQVPIDNVPFETSHEEKLENAMREQFSILVAKVRKGKKNEAIPAIEMLLDKTDGIVPSHKHMFNDFGIDLRKLYLFPLSVKAFERAHLLSEEDTHVMFNLARVYSEMKQFAKAQEFIQKVLKQDPDMEVAHKLRKFINTLNPIRL